jgi:D-xylonolactonase
MDQQIKDGVRCVWPLGAELGEGPLWDERKACLYFVDIKQCRVHAFEPSGGACRSWQLPDYVCWLVARHDGDGFVAGLRSEIVRLWLEPELRTAPLATPMLAPGVRLNDAKADAHGRIWAGTMHNTDYTRADGELLRLDPDGSLAAQDQGYHICNGPAFSLGNATMYHTDSFLGKVYAYRNGERTLWRQFDGAAEGGPDGMTVDSAGCLWIAQWGGWRVCRYAPDGSLMATIRLPVSQPASCTFGGADLKTLFITTARESLSGEQLAREPLAGALFAVDLAVGGMAPARY